MRPPQFMASHGVAIGTGIAAIVCMVMAVKAGNKPASTSSRFARYGVLFVLTGGLVWIVGMIGIAQGADWWIAIPYMTGLGSVGIGLILLVVAAFAWLSVRSTTPKSKQHAKSV